MSSVPKVSIFTASKNGGRYLVDTIESVLNQTFKDYEHVIVDGASTDNTVEILKRYSHIRWISEPDGSPAEGFYKALRMCRGDYIFQCCVSDGFLDRKWFETCVGLLEKDRDISMVYGFPQYMTEDGHLGRIAYSEFFNQPPPQKEEFLPFWLATKFMFPEGNYCVRREVFIDCYPRLDSCDFFDVVHPFLKFVYNFNIKGYLSFFVPLIANFGRTHPNWIQQQDEQAQSDVEKTLNMYYKGIDDYKKGLLRGWIPHVYRNGKGEVIGEASAKALKSYKRIIRYYQKTYPNFGKNAAPLYSHALKKVKKSILFMRYILRRSQ
jgi:glycosyltransferase involved in cell wall biosynthesis